MSNPEDIFGGDILLDENGQAVVAANGELVWCDGLTAALQDLKLRLFTPLGGLFYDRKFGSAIPHYVYDDNTKSNRLSLLAEIIRRLELDGRVLAGSVDAAILKWDEKGLSISVTWRFWDVEEPQNLTVSLTRPGAERLVEDIDLEA